MPKDTDPTRAESEQTADGDAVVDKKEPLPGFLQQIVDVILSRYTHLEIHPKADNWLEVYVSTEEASQFFSFLKETPELAFDYLSDLTAVDYEDKGFQVVYHLVAVGVDAANVHRKLVIKIDVPRDEPRVPTAVNVWPTANFLEREVYDLMGVVFDDHPDLRRILMREDWVGHPLRKDYVDERPPRPRVVKKS